MSADDAQTLSRRTAIGLTGAGLALAGTQLHANGSQSRIIARADRLPALNIKDFGALCDAAPDGTTGTDDTAAVQSAIDAAAVAGGASIFIPGHTKCASSIDVAQKHNVTFAGISGTGAGGSAPPPTQLIYTGAGQRFIDARSSYAVTFRDLGIRYASPSFGGALIDFAHNRSEIDSAYGLIERCYLGGFSGRESTTAILASLNQTIICSVIDSNFQLAAVGVKGGHGSYSNSITIERCTFGTISKAAIMNAIQMWTVQNCTFERGPRAYHDDQVGGVTDRLSWLNNWHGDGSSVGADTWFSFGKTQMRSLLVAGNFFDTSLTNTAGVKLSAAVEGAEIIANTFAGGSNSGIDFGGVAHYGVHISGNFWVADPVHIHADTNDLWIIANKRDGSFAKTYIRVADAQHIHLGKLV